MSTFSATQTQSTPSGQQAYPVQGWEGGFILKCMILLTFIWLFFS